MILGLTMLAVSGVAALEVDLEVIAGFNVDGLTMILAAIGLVLVIRALLPSRHDLRVVESGSGAGAAGPA